MNPAYVQTVNLLLDIAPNVKGEGGYRTAHEMGKQT
jgi:hypothetical protein